VPSASLATEEAALVSRREPYARVTVVWSASPVSARAGDAGLVTADGRLRGWIGGSCAEPVVVRQALDALAEGRSRLVHLAPPDDLPPPRPGTVNAAVSCASEGSLEVFVEPRLPPAQLVVVGRSPLVRALATMAGVVGFDVAVVERDGLDVADFPEPTRVIDHLDLAAAGVGPASFVVVATMGRYDEDAVEAALASGAGFVALVASGRRAATVAATLRAAGVADDDLARVRAPAGLDLGDLPHAEIAVAVLAEIVAAKSAAAASSATAPPVLAVQVAEIPTTGAARTEGEAVDPVCGMPVDPTTAGDVAVHDGVTYTFCCSGCRRRFEAAPEQFLTPA
jgi:xanthine dehydrogenase accessory factor